MRRPPYTDIQRRLDIGLLALAIVTAIAVIVALVWDSQPAQSTRESSYTPPAVSVPQDKRETVLFVGDSYSAGARATKKSARWTSVAARTLGWKEQNIAAGGTGYYAAVPASDSKNACDRDYCPNYSEALAEYDGPNPDAVVISGGRNDSSMDIGDFREAVIGVLEASKARFPDARIYVVNPVWDDDDTPANFDAMVSAVEDEATTAGVIFVNIGQPLTSNEDFISEDGVHPNNAGHKALAEAFVSEVQ